MRIFIASIIIFLTILCLILLIRSIFSFLLDRAYKNYQKLKNLTTKNQIKNQKKYEKEEDELRRNIEIPRANSAVKAEKRSKQANDYEIIPSEEQELDRQELSQVEIVDIVKPIGFWTSMILGQKLTYLIQSAQMLNKRGNKGFWVSMIEAKDRAAGRQHGRGM